MSRFIGKLFPQESPLKLLYEHAKLVEQASGQILPAFRKFLSGEPVEDLAQLVDELEDKADEVKVRIREVYSKLKFVYFDKMDLLLILHDQDAVIDAVDDFLKLLTIYRFEKPLPKELTDMLLELAEKVRDAIKYMTESVHELLNLVESSFSPTFVQQEDSLTRRVEADESGTDRLSLALGKKVFSLKNVLHPVDILFIEKLTRLLTRSADHAENVAEKVRMITRS
ncbi:DUF47 domain-containing protein [Pseudothermotoga sp.]|nr:DUF47 family protein [Pseudothermotoga sp.]MCX7812162.1 DUF47 family protein [Pseudothermotoga sp.]MDW8139232.1 DUF47 family protein [Pseudothermotoga sp.]